MRRASRSRIANPLQSGAIVASMRGTLAAGVDLSDAEDGGAIYFRFEDPGTGFVIARDAFRRAGLLDDGALAVDQGGLGLIVEAGPCPSVRA